MSKLIHQNASRVHLSLSIDQSDLEPFDNQWASNDEDDDQDVMLLKNHTLGRSQGGGAGGLMGVSTYLFGVL